MLTWCLKRKADIIFLQETHSKIELEKQWKNEWGGEMLYSHGSLNYCGVVVLIRNSCNCSVQKFIIDPLGRFIISKVDIEDEVCLLVNIYAPKKDKDIVKFFNCWPKTLQIEYLDCEEDIIISPNWSALREIPLRPSSKRS